LLSFQSYRVENVVSSPPPSSNWKKVDLLRDCDRRADERFRMLDMMEKEDGETQPR